MVSISKRQQPYRDENVNPRPPTHESSMNDKEPTHYWGGCNWPQNIIIHRYSPVYSRNIKIN